MIYNRFLLRILDKYLKNYASSVSFVKLHRDASNSNKIKRPIRTMHRKWEPALSKIVELKDNSGKNLKQFRLLSYNILAQDLLVDNLFLYCDVDTRFLHWNYRLEQIIQEVSKLQPDILCLQEVQHNHINELLRQLRCRGLEGHKLEYVFKKRTGNRCDGCAIIYDRNKFKLIKEQSVEYFTKDDAILNRENVAIMAKFEIRDDPSCTFIATNTHLLYNPRRVDVRMSQINKLLSALAKFSEGHRSNNKRCPFIIVGDFNCPPGSVEYNALTSTRAQTFNASDGDINLENISFGHDTASTFQGKWVTVDYILRSRWEQNNKNLEVNSVYKLPTVDECNSYGKLPNKCSGSDHLSLAIQFSIV